MTTHSTVSYGLALGLALLAFGAVAEECTDSSPCPEPSEYCRYNDGACEGTGRCEPRPEICTREYNPVCGCDGMTYGNACEAAAAGINVAREGECDDVGCGSNEDCDDGAYCCKKSGDCGGSGRCEPRPEMCTAMYDPMCGCDGKTYSSACDAARAGANIAYAAHGGECETGD